MRTLMLAAVLSACGGVPVNEENPVGEVTHQDFQQTEDEYCDGEGRWSDGCLVLRCLEQGGTMEWCNDVMAE